MKPTLFDRIRKLAATHRMRAMLVSLVLMSTGLWFVQPVMAANAVMSPAASDTQMIIASAFDTQADEAQQSPCDDETGSGHLDGSSAGDDLNDHIPSFLQRRMMLDGKAGLHCDDRRHAVLRVISEAFRPPIA